MSEIVEKVARAIVEGLNGTRGRETDRAIAIFGDDYRASAHAAISAMAENIDEGMTKTLIEAIFDHGGTLDLHRDKYRASLQAALHAALSPTQDGEKK